MNPFFLNTPACARFVANTQITRHNSARSARTPARRSVALVLDAAPLKYSCLTGLEPLPL